MTANRAIRFVRTSPPYHAGDVAGFAPARAQQFVDKGIAVYPDAKPVPELSFDDMSRDDLVKHGRTVLGFDEDPPADVTDEQIRDALKAHAHGMQVPGPTPSLDMLDAMDRPHLEAFAKVKAGIAEIDPDLSDDELRAQIRDIAEIRSKVAETPAVLKKKGR